jgi:uncharacterized protein YciI
MSDQHEVTMTYLVILRRTPSFDPRGLPEHRAFLDRLRAEGRLERSGPFADQTGGAYVLTAASLAEAMETAASDPLVQGGVSDLEIHAWAAR